MNIKKKYDIYEIENKDKERWNKFVSNSDNGHYEQSSFWAEIKKSSGWRSLIVIALENDIIVGGFQLIYKNFPLFGGIGYVTKGPVCNACSNDIATELIKKLKVIVKKYRIRYLLVQPPEICQNHERLLVKKNFRLAKDIDIVNATTIIDLHKDIDTIFENMTKNNRRFIKQAFKKNVVIRSGGRYELRIFFYMMKETCARQGVDPNPPNLESLYDLWDIFSEQNAVKYFIAEYKNETISALLLLNYAGTARAWKLGWSGKYGKIRPNQLLFWESIKWAKENNYRYYDFVGIEKKEAEQILSGKHFSEVSKGASFFKLMFGGEVIILPDGYEYIYNPIIRIIYFRLFLKIVRNPLLQKFFTKYIGFFPIRKMKY